MIKDLKLVRCVMAILITVKTDIIDDGSKSKNKKRSKIHDRQSHDKRNRVRVNDHNRRHHRDWCGDRFFCLGVRGGAKGRIVLCWVS